MYILNTNSPFSSFLEKSVTPSISSLIIIIVPQIATNLFAYFFSKGFFSRYISLLNPSSYVSQGDKLLHKKIFWRLESNLRHIGVLMEVLVVSPGWTRSLTHSIDFWNYSGNPDGKRIPSCINIWFIYSVLIYIFLVFCLNLESYCRRVRFLKFSWRSTCSLILLTNSELKTYLKKVSKFGDGRSSFNKLLNLKEKEPW